MRFVILNGGFILCELRKLKLDSLNENTYFSLRLQSVKATEIHRDGGKLI